MEDFFFFSFDKGEGSEAAPAPPEEICPNLDVVTKEEWGAGAPRGHIHDISGANVRAYGHIKRFHTRGNAKRFLCSPSGTGSSTTP